jgi:hypothetical protein
VKIVLVAHDPAWSGQFTHEAEREYANLKQLLAAQRDGEMRCYSDGKTAFIRAIEQRAAIWQRQSNSNHQPYNEERRPARMVPTSCFCTSFRMGRAWR